MALIRWDLTQNLIKNLNLTYKNLYGGIQLKKIQFQLKYNDAELTYIAYFDKNGKITDVESQHPETGAWNAQPL